MKHSSSASLHLLTAYAQKPLATIHSCVASDALASESPVQYLEDVLQFGCASGTVFRLMYYTDTHRFFDAHYSEIEELRTAFEADTGSAISIKGDLKNTLAWFAYESVAAAILQELQHP